MKKYVEKSSKDRERSFGQMKQKKQVVQTCLALLRGKDLNLRPLGYEPNELPLLHPAMFSGAKIQTFCKPTKLYANYFAGAFVMP